MGIRAFLVLEGNLQKRLTSAWAAYARPRLDDVLRLASDGQYTEALEVIRYMDAVVAVEDEIGYAEFVAVSAFLSGAANVKRNDPRNTAVARGKLVPRDIIEGVVATMFDSFEEITRTVQAQATRGVLEARERREEVRKADAALADWLNGQVMGGGRALYNVGANLTTSRLTSYGFLSEAREQKVQTYQISEQLDDRICPVCERMHGRTFSTGLAYDRLDATMRTRDHRQQKFLAPFWPSGKAHLRRLHESSDNDLQVIGFDAPPFHPSCRGVLVAAGSVERRKLPVPEVAEQPVETAAQPATPTFRDTLEKFTDKTTGKLTAERQALHDRLVARELDGKSPFDSKRPVAHLLGGGPGGGKGTLQKAPGFVNPARGNSITIDPDEYKKALPDFKDMVASGKARTAAAFVHEESSLLRKRVTNEAIRQRIDITLDGTGDGSLDKLLKQSDELREAGYAVHANYVTIPTNEAIERALARAERTGRVVPPATVVGIHQKVSEVFPQAIANGVFDTAKLWDMTDSLTTGPRLVFEFDGTRSIVHDRVLWDAFLRKTGTEPSNVIPNLQYADELP